MLESLDGRSRTLKTAAEEMRPRYFSRSRSLGQEGGELALRHLAGSHGELAMLDLSESADIAVDLHVARRIREHHPGRLAVHQHGDDRGIERVAADQAVLTEPPEIADAAAPGRGVGEDFVLGIARLLQGRAFGAADFGPMPQLDAALLTRTELNGEVIDPLYLAAVEAVEEALVNALVAGEDAPTAKPEALVVRAIDHEALTRAFVG